MELSTIEIAAFIFGIIYVGFMMRVSRWAWVAGNISVVLQAWSFFMVQLYADVLLQAVYFGMGVLGWIQWQHNHESRTARSERPIVRRLRWDNVPYWALCVLAGATVLSFLFSRYTNASLPYLDSSLAALSIAATALQIRKYIESWLLWVVVDVAYILVYISKNLEVIAALYLIFTILAIVGWREWRTYEISES